MRNIHHTLRSQLSFESINVHIWPSNVAPTRLYSRKSDIFWPKFTNSMTPSSRGCYSLRGLTFIGLCASLSTIKIYKSQRDHFWNDPSHCFRECESQYSRRFQSQFKSFPFPGLTLTKFGIYIVQIRRLCFEMYRIKKKYI